MPGYPKRPRHPDRPFLKNGGPCENDGEESGTDGTAEFIGKSWRRSEKLQEKLDSHELPENR
jgi:hypothetical protein